MKKLSFVIAFILVLQHPTANGCEISPLKTYQVAPHFSVVVMHQGKAISGIEITITPIAEPATDPKNVEPVFIGITDSRGSVDVRDLKIGRYFVKASHEDIDDENAIAEVNDESSEHLESRIAFQWADWSYRTQAVTGNLTGLIPGGSGKPLWDLLHPQEAVYPGVSMVLRNAFSNDSYRTNSDSTGKFDFGPIPEGIYTLTIAGGMKSLSGLGSETLLVIDVEKNNSRMSLPLRLKDSGCYRTEFTLEEPSAGSTVKS